MADQKKKHTYTYLELFDQVLYDLFSARSNKSLFDYKYLALISVSQFVVLSRYLVLCALFLTTFVSVLISLNVFNFILIGETQDQLFVHNYDPVGQIRELPIKAKSGVGRVRYSVNAIYSKPYTASASILGVESVASSAQWNDNACSFEVDGALYSSGDTLKVKRPSSNVYVCSSFDVAAANVEFYLVNKKDLNLSKIQSGVVTSGNTHCTLAEDVTSDHAIFVKGSNSKTGSMMSCGLSLDSNSLVKK